LRTSSRLETGLRLAMPLPPRRLSNGQTAAIDHGWIFATTQTRLEPDLDRIHKVLQGLPTGSSLRQAAR